MAYDQVANFSVTGTYGSPPEGEDDVYTIEEFMELCDCGAFIDYDGFGHPIKDGAFDGSIMVKPSRRKMIPADATHIIWYNR